MRPVTTGSRRIRRSRCPCRAGRHGYAELHGYRASVGGPRRSARSASRHGPGDPGTRGLARAGATVRRAEKPARENRGSSHVDCDYNVIFAREDDRMDIDKLRLRIEELSQRFGVDPPDVVYGEPPQGADCTLKRRGKSSLIIVGATFETMPEHAQEADLAWVIAASDRERLRKEGVPARVARSIGAAIGITGVLLFFLVGSIVLAVTASLTLLIVIGLPIMMRAQVYTLDRRVAEVCGRETVHRALEYWQENPPRMRGLYRLVMKLQPSSARRAARLTSARTTPFPA